MAENTGGGAGGERKPRAAARAPRGLLVEGERWPRGPPGGGGGARAPSAAFRREVGDGTVTGRAGCAARVGGRWAETACLPTALRFIFFLFLFFFEPFLF